jgi:hypothetical protein
MWNVHAHLWKSLSEPLLLQIPGMTPAGIHPLVCIQSRYGASGHLVREHERHKTSQSKSAQRCGVRIRITTGQQKKKGWIDWEKYKGLTSWQRSMRGSTVGKSMRSASSTQGGGRWTYRAGMEIGHGKADFLVRLKTTRRRVHLRAPDINVGGLNANTTRLTLIPGGLKGYSDGKRSTPWYSPPT